MAGHPQVYRPTRAEGEAALREARRMFNRVLGAWASDVLTLRRCGRLEPRWNAATQRQRAA